MEKLSRMQMIQKADKMSEFSRKILNEKRTGLLRQAAQLYKDATLSLMAEAIEKEADNWEIWWKQTRLD